MTLDIEKMREMLKTRLDELRSLYRSGDDERATVMLDQQSIGRLARMDLLQRQQMAKETERRRRLEARKIESALARLEDGEVG